MRGWMLSLMIGASGAQAASFRPDLIKAAPVFCGETTSSLIEARVSDAQIELAMVKDVSDLASFAEGFAKDNGHHGFAFGSCADHRQWIVSTPAPAAVMVQREKDLVIAIDKLRSVCATYDVDGLKAETNQPVALIHADKPTGGTRILTLKDDFTTLSLTCHPLDKSQDGPELWTLIALRTEGTPK
ncbi:MAG: hypothetical protein H7249_01160, partial [Chitinophagaceae bacterium]|nr:hypothetical protein [Oligoflexus sp.]